MVRPLLQWVCLGLCWVQGSQLRAAEIEFRRDDQGRYVEVGPLAELGNASAEEDPARLFTVHVDGSARSILGEYQQVGTYLRFKPRFSFRPGIIYVVRLTDECLARSQSKSRSFRFSLPDPEVTEKCHVVQVYPTSRRLPENLLKFYIHFSGPMSRGEAYRRIRLLNSNGRPIDLPFLELGEELWDPGGRRLTLLFDPGRIKRGLKPREEAGQVLRKGQSYVLEIDPLWLDARGVPLARAFRKEFEVVGPDHQQPNPADWKLTVPSENSVDPFVVRFKESLDRAMLHRVLRIFDEDGDPVSGRVHVDQSETRWSFRPEGAWKASEYRLVFDSTLEDVAGNSIGRPFEVDAADTADERPIVRQLRFKATNPSK